jgi:DNA-binding NarL/FixJ family response regulator
MTKLLLLDENHLFSTQFEKYFNTLEDYTITIKHHITAQNLDTLLNDNTFDLCIVGEVSDNQDEIVAKLCDHKTSGLILKMLSAEEISKAVFMIQSGVAGLWCQTSIIEDLHHVVTSYLKYGAYIDPMLTHQIINKIHQPENILLIKNTSLKSKSKQVLRLLKDGYTYEEIAQKLHTTIDVVRYYIKDIYKTLGVKNKIAAINKSKFLQLN